MIRDFVVLPLARIKCAPYNPNKMTERKFQQLVEEIASEGFREPLYVALMDGEMRRKYLEADEDDRDPWYLIIGGEHRYRAAERLELPALPCVVRTDLTDDEVKVRNVRANLIKGKLDPVKFVQLYEEVAEKHGEEFATVQMGFVDARELKGLIRAVRSDLPPEVRDKFDTLQDEIKTPDDLQRIVAELLAAHGDTVPLGYAVFSYGGQTHAWIEMTAALRKQLEEITTWCYTHQRPAGDVLSALFPAKLAQALDKLEKTPPAVSFD